MPSDKINKAKFCSLVLMMMMNVMQYELHINSYELFTILIISRK